MAKKNAKKKPAAKRARSARRKRVAWPPKTREIQNAIFDSTRWNGFVHRPDDIVIVTWAKAGTTWMQQIVAQLVCGAPDGVGLLFDSPWLDMRGFPLDQVVAGLEAQTHRRFIKTHLPVDALACPPTVKYIYVVRDARDVVWSAHNHQSSFTDEALAMFNDTPGRVGPPLTRPTVDVRDYYLHFLEHEGSLPGFIDGFWKHVQGWWDVRHAPNVLLVHFNDLKADLAGEVRRIARFLGLSIPRGRLSTIVEHCSFDYMRREFAKLDMMHHIFKGGGETFIHKGTNGRWKDLLSAREIERCDEEAARHLSADCARWVKTGALPGRPPAQRKRARARARGVKRARNGRAPIAKKKRRRA